jgi:hypothetical protein
MIMDSDSDECQCNLAATEEEEYCEEILMEPHLQLQCYGSTQPAFSQYL